MHHLPLEKNACVLPCYSLYVIHALRMQQPLWRSERDPLNKIIATRAVKPQCCKLLVLTRNACELQRPERGSCWRRHVTEHHLCPLSCAGHLKEIGHGIVARSKAKKIDVKTKKKEFLSFCDEFEAFIEAELGDEREEPLFKASSWLDLDTIEWHLSHMRDAYLRSFAVLAFLPDVGCAAQTLHQYCALIGVARVST